MNSATLRWITLLAGALLAFATAADGPAYGVCRQQIADYVQQRLGQTVTRIDVRTYADRSTVVDHGDALVQVKECSGFHAFEVYGTETTCEHIPHYGQSTGSHVRYQGAYEGCGKGR